MVISYKKLWIIFEQRRITKKELCRRADVSLDSIRNMTRCQRVSLDVFSQGSVSGCISAWATSLSVLRSDILTTPATDMCKRKDLL